MAQGKQVVYNISHAIRQDKKGDNWLFHKALCSVNFLSYVSQKLLANARAA